MRDRTPALPAAIELYAKPWPCSPVTYDKIPKEYYVTSRLADSNIQDADASNVAEHGSGTVGFFDTFHAVYLTAGMGAPSNKVKLQNLSDQLAKDFWGWRLVAFDTVYNGIIAPDLDGHTDEATWTYTADRCETRVKTAPWDDFPESFNHSDPIGDCLDCFKVYSPDVSVGSQAACKPIKYCLSVIDGALHWTKS